MKQDELVDASATAGHRLLFDADCGVCTKVAMILRNRARQPLELVPMHEVADGTGLHATLGDERFWASAHYIDARGREFHDGASVTRALRLLPGGFVFAVLDAPGLRWLRDRAYYAFARNRHRISRLLGLQECRL